MAVYVYTRCSTGDKGQDSMNQLMQIMKRYPVKFWFDDYGYSGSLSVAERPALQRIHRLAKRGDTVVVYDWTRLSRRLSVGATFADDMAERGVNLVSITNDYDITTPQGKLMFGVELSVGENFRLAHIQKVKDGMENAKRKGIHCGRSSDGNVDQARQMLADGVKVAKIVEVTGVSKAHIYRMKKAIETA